MEPIVVNGERLTIGDVWAVAHGGAPVALSDDPAFLALLERSRAFLMDYIARGYPTYGVTTGFGDSCSGQISPEKAEALQRSIVAFHGIGLGSPFSREEGRAVVLCRLNSDVKGGHSAIRVELARRLADLLNHDVIPVIPRLGSVGASGDLTPLSYLAAVIMGERNAYYRGRVVPAAEALRAEGLEPLPLAAKEGLALMNGTSVMTAVASLSWRRARRLAAISDFLTAATSEIVRGKEVPFRRKVSEIKNHPGQIESAEYVYGIIRDAPRVYRYEDFLAEMGAMDGGYQRREQKIQDRYSVRCAPQITGVLRDTLRVAREWIEQELNSANDNPLVDVESGSLLNTGNFYGGHICAACDYLRIALANVSDLADKQAELIIDGKFNGLTDNLIPVTADDDPRAGLRFGFKAAQITMSAIRGEVQGLCGPASITSAPTEALNQDKVSMGTISARKLSEQVDLIYLQFAVHVLAACQAVDIVGADSFSPFMRKVHGAVRGMSAFVRDDRPLDADAAAVARWLEETELFGE